MSQQNGQSVFLLVEDDEDDIYFFNDALNMLGSSFKLEIVQNGNEVLKKLDFLYAKSSLPCLIILDINLPGINGKEVFQLIKKNSKYNNIPIVVLTTSCSQEEKSYFLLNDVEFFTKPVNMESLINLVGKIAMFCES